MPKQIITCVVCDQKFETGRKGAMTCSAKCRALRNREQSRINNKIAYEEKDKRIQDFSFECPWESGRLPKTVTKNQPWL